MIIKDPSSFLTVPSSTVCRMLKPFLLLSSCLFAFYFGGVTGNTFFTGNGAPELMAAFTKAYPQCGAKLFNNATMLRMENCIQLTGLKVDWKNGPFCCAYWDGMQCMRNIIWNINECKPIRFGNDLSYEIMKQSGKLCDPATFSCPNAPHIKPIVKGVMENIFLPLQELLSLYTECSASIGVPLTVCNKPFDQLLYGHSLEHPDSVVCDSQWSFYKCFQEVTSKDPKCEVAKEDIEVAVKQIKENITKKGCPPK